MEVTFTPVTLILSSFLWTVVEEKVFVYIFSGKVTQQGFDKSHFVLSFGLIFFFLVLFVWYWG